MSEWRPIPGWPDYEASNDGLVRRITAACGTRPGRIRKATPDKNGYLMLSLSSGGVARRFCIHVLVCEAFHGPRPSPDHEAAHWDGDHHNNSAANLRWATRAENEEDKLRHGRQLRGETHPNAKLTDDQVIAIREIWRATPRPWGTTGILIERLADQFGVRPGGIADIVRNRSRHHTNTQAAVR